MHTACRLRAGPTILPAPSGAAQRAVLRTGCLAPLGSLLHLLEDGKVQGLVTSFLSCVFSFSSAFSRLTVSYLAPPYSCRQR